MLYIEQNSEWKCKFFKRMAIEMFRLCLKIMFTSHELEWWHQHNAMRTYMQLPRFFFNFGQPFVWISYSPFKHLFALFCQDFAPHSCWQYWWNGLKPKITVGPAVYIVCPTISSGVSQEVRRQKHQRLRRPKSFAVSSIIIIKSCFWIVLASLRLSYTPGIVESHQS